MFIKIILIYRDKKIITRGGYMEIKLLNSKDVSKILGVSISKASNIIRALNNLKVARGTPKECVIAGKIDEQFFYTECNYKK